MEEDCDKKQTRQEPDEGVWDCTAEGFLLIDSHATIWVYLSTLQLRSVLCNTDVKGRAWGKWTQKWQHCC